MYAVWSCILWNLIACLLRESCCEANKWMVARINEEHVLPIMMCWRT